MKFLFLSYSERTRSDKKAKVFFISNSRSYKNNTQGYQTTLCDKISNETDLRKNWQHLPNHLLE